MKKNWFLYVLVFVAGAAVLAIEILGTRILGPFYGVSLFLWSALITVTLAALSLGYAVGGRWADRGPKLSLICYATAAAGAWLLLIPWIRAPVLRLAEPLGLRAAVLLATLVLFAAPLTLLGMVSPYAIRLRALHLGEVGRTAGDIYAISTVGSVLAALATGFLLIPNVGVGRLTASIGLALLLVAAAGLFAARRGEGVSRPAVAMVVLTVLFWFGIPANGADPEHGLLAVEQSAYAEIRVLDLDERRHLLIDGGVHSVVNPSSWESYYPYVSVVDLTGRFFERPGGLLLIGLGGGSIAKNFARAGWSVDSVEIDPVVTRVAREHFGLEGSDTRVFEMDGREFLIRRDETYDLIVLDAFGSSSIPFHLVTKESFGLIAARLTDVGVLVVNVEARGWTDLIVRSFAATLAPHFSQIQALPTTPRPDVFGNVIMVAANRQLDLPDELKRDALLLREASSMDQVQRFAWSQRFEPQTSGAPLLTDDLNPVDVWSEEINHIARKDLHEYFGPYGRSW